MWRTQDIQPEQVDEQAASGNCSVLSQGIVQLKAQEVLYLGMMAY